MKKSLIALAVAGAFAAPAFAATSNVDVYGVLNIAIEDTDATNVTPSVLDYTSRLGFKGSEDLGGGMKAIWQIESALGGNGATIGGGTLASRNTFVGLAGGFGTVLMGRHDTPYKLGTASLDPFADTIGDYNLGRAGGVELLMNAHDARLGNALAYISPTWSGFHFAAAAVLANEATPTNNDTVDAISFTGVYINGPLFGSLSYQNVKDVGLAGQDSGAWKLGLGYTIGDGKIGFVYEKVSADVATVDRKTWLLNGSYAMGPIVLKAEYGRVNNATLNLGAVSDDQNMWVLGADYNLSKRTTAYFVYVNSDSDYGGPAVALGIPGAVVPAGAGNQISAGVAGGVSGWNIGIKHSF